ncbi:MAG: response regulator [Oscillospiraceae bacterium]|nr:response regulator [Oscillospiraceae bacterium]
MDKLRLLIADGSEDFRQALADVLNGAYILRLCWEGHETLELMRSFKPDILVLDLMLPGLDGITILQHAADAGMQPMVLATSRYVSDYVVDAINKLGVEYVMIKPCDARATVARISDLTQRLKKPLFSQPDPRAEVSNLLLALGVPTKLRGYAYLREAILELMRNPGQPVTKELYPTVGTLCCATAVQVERSIRSAIAAAWAKRDEHLWRMYFQPEPDGTMPRPTNAAFISRLANALLLRGGTDNAV